MIHVRIEPKYERHTRPSYIDGRENPEQWTLHPLDQTTFLITKHRAIFSRYKMFSKLLRVNRESRDESWRFYRVRVPCVIAAPKTLHEFDCKEIPCKPGLLLFNPEYDFLCIESTAIETGYVATRAQAALLDFLHHLHKLQTPNSRTPNLTNLAIKDARRLPCVPRQLSCMDYDVRESIRQTFANLK
ncbi:hypothetical protein BCR34DRAFT_178649 [Clohesyomyces aquaticus]|uniref:Uncharacterized protein n=1 Tax=Clohesyomyces aquaticus TaxID=1231657 RepID=A0A1Y1ZZ01_9PLEO|nr:hypothetical protein BCR34DRAFT_178649 [Clohesyomyces aquaticus]